MNLYEMAIVCKTRNGLWQSWIHQDGGYYQEFSTKQEAIDNCVNLVRQKMEQYFEKHNISIRERNYTVHWFDPSKDYVMFDTAFMVQDDKFYTFLGYKDGKARVMANTGEESFVDPQDLMPCKLHGSW